MQRKNFTFFLTDSFYIFWIKSKPLVLVFWRNHHKAQPCQWCLFYSFIHILPIVIHKFSTYKKPCFPANPCFANVF